MYFTQNDYKKIENWLSHRSIKDTEFPTATQVFNNDIITIIQNRENKKTTIHSILDHADFVNLSDKYKQYYVNPDQLISLVPKSQRKLGYVMTFQDKYGHWDTLQFIGGIDQWDSLSSWKNPLLNAIEKYVFFPDEEDITGKRIKDKVYLKFKDKLYDPDTYSGFGRIFLRKNLVCVGSDDSDEDVYENRLTQDMFTQTYTIYFIQYDYDLNGETITIPEGSVLYFCGGTINNGTVQLQENPVWGVFTIEAMGTASFIHPWATGQVFWFTDDSYKSLTGDYFTETTKESSATSTEDANEDTEVFYQVNSDAYTTVERLTLCWWNGEKWIRILDITDYNEIISILNAIIEKHNAEISAVYKYFKARCYALEVRTDSLEGRMDSAESRLDSAESRLDSAESRLDSAEDRLDGIDSSIADIEANITTINSNIDDINSSITNINSNISELESSINSTISSLKEELLAAIDAIELPIATTSVLGGVIIGDGINVSSDGTISISTDWLSEYVNNNFDFSSSFDEDTFSEWLNKYLSVTSYYTSGTIVAKININGTDYDIYVPESESNSDSSGIDSVSISSASLIYLVGVTSTSDTSTTTLYRSSSPIGGVARPIYLTSDGALTACNQYSSTNVNSVDFIPHVSASGYMRIGRYIYSNANGTSNGYDVCLDMAPDATAVRKYYFAPGVGEGVYGVVVADRTDGGVAIGSSSIPVYVDSNGEIHACSYDLSSLSYTLPTATASILGGVIIGDGINVDTNGVISIDDDYIESLIESNTTNYWYKSSNNIYAGTSTTPSYAVYATAFYESSDARLKNNIFNIDDGDIEKVNEIQHKTFTLNSDGSKHYGVIAQSVEEVGLERLVSVNEDGYKSVDYTSLLILENEALRRTVSNLEKRLAALEAKLG